MKLCRLLGASDIAYEIISCINNMLFTLTGCSETKFQHFLMIKFIQTQFRKLYKPINDFFNLTCLQINLKNQSI